VIGLFFCHRLLLNKNRLLESWSWLGRPPKFSAFSLGSLHWLILGRLLTPHQVLAHENHLSPPSLGVEQVCLQLRLPAQVDLEGGALVAGDKAGDWNA